MRPATPHELLDVADIEIVQAVSMAVVAIVSGRKESLSAGGDFHVGLAIEASLDQYLRTPRPALPPSCRGWMMPRTL